MRQNANTANAKMNKTKKNAPSPREGGAPRGRDTTT